MNLKATTVVLFHFTAIESHFEFLGSFEFFVFI